MRKIMFGDVSLARSLWLGGFIALRLNPTERCIEEVASQLTILASHQADVEEATATYQLLRGRFDDVKKTAQTTTDPKGVTATLDALADELKGLVEAIAALGPFEVSTDSTDKSGS